jgi:hypothetical protein
MRLTVASRKRFHAVSPVIISKGLISDSHQKRALLWQKIGLYATSSMQRIKCADVQNKKGHP